jgi:hypothetical protein
MIKGLCAMWKQIKTSERLASVVFGSLLVIMSVVLLIANFDYSWIKIIVSAITFLAGINLILLKFEEVSKSYTSTGTEVIKKMK